MQELTKLIYEDMKPALGVTEPGAIAFATAKAKSYTKGEIKKVSVSLNSGMYKNAFTCGIPNSTHVGNSFAAALGVIAGDSDKGLESLDGVKESDNLKAQEMIDAGIVEAKLSSITPDIYIEATVETDLDSCTVLIKGSHTNIVKITVNGKVIFEKEEKKSQEKNEEQALIHKYSLEQIVNYIKSVDIKEIEFIKKAYSMNCDLFQEALKSSKTTFIHQLLKNNNNEIISKDVVKTAQLLCNGAIEGRVIGLDKPAMSITGSGAHGIIATMPLLAEQKVKNLTEEKLLRATALSYLVCMYIKEYSGRLSAFCGCGIAAGTGMACGILYMRDGSLEQMKYCINNMASSITGMICDGGNQGCTMKGILAVDIAFRSVEFALNNVYVYDVHGINGKTPEATMRNMGMIASPGMVETEKTIIDIFENK